VVKKRTRYCDVCAAEIPKGEKYSVRTMAAEGAALLLDVDDPELVPTWTQNSDGTVRLDICTVCCVSMSGSPDNKVQ
jgi:hypothetical protein